MNSIGRRSRAGLFALSVFVSAASTSAAPVSGDLVSMESVPLFARFASDDASLRGYKVPVHLNGSLHKFFFTIGFERDGEVSFQQPDSLDFTVNAVPQQYSALLAQLGEPRMWPYLYTFTCEKTIQTDGTTVYELHGVPKSSSSDVDHVVIHMRDDDAPIQAEWVLHDGWAVTSTIQMEPVGTYLLPKEDNADITGHGFRIHSDVKYGSYVVTS